MEVDFENDRMQALAESKKDLSRKYGQQALKISQRIGELRASDDLLVFGKLPGTRPHPLKENLRGLFSTDLRQPYRLIFEPVGIYDPADPKTITAIKIVNLCTNETHE